MSEASAVESKVRIQIYYNFKHVTVWCQITIYDNMFINFRNDKHEYTIESYTIGYCSGFTPTSTET